MGFTPDLLIDEAKIPPRYTRIMFQESICDNSGSHLLPLDPSSNLEYNLKYLKLLTTF